MSLRAALANSGAEPVIAPLALEPLSARIARGAGFEYVYVSGGALGYAYGVSEALLSVTEVADATRRVYLYGETRVIADVGVGFGDPVHVHRTVKEMEVAGACALEIEDQVAPKRVSHHRGIEHLVSTQEMCQKIEQCVAARSDEEMLIIARTGAVKNESFANALERLQSYAAAGADVLMLMPEDRTQVEKAREVLDRPLATITSMDLVKSDRFANSGWNLFIDPFTAQVLSTRIVQSAYKNFAEQGHTGVDLAELFADYHRLDELAGLSPLYGIEDLTTELDTNPESQARNSKE